MKIITKPESIPPGGTLTFAQIPSEAFRVDAIRLTSEDPRLDIQYSQVGNVMLAAFSKRRFVCDPQTRILVVVENTGKEPLSTSVEIEGPSVTECL